MVSTINNFIFTPQVSDLSFVKRGGSMIKIRYNDKRVELRGSLPLAPYSLHLWGAMFSMMHFLLTLKTLDSKSGRSHVTL